MIQAANMPHSNVEATSRWPVGTGIGIVATSLIFTAVMVIAFVAPV